ncbi:MAG: CBM9 family sugar-binding protein, partial [Gammaproteobacteria bacterium]|nr:CBM9 family sugar-binding protein [Gammaproteobacteria bacterium]
RELNSELPNSHLSVNRRITAGFGSAPLPQTVEFSVGLGTGPLSFRNASTRQDVYEVRIPIADLGITIGQPFGIEMQLDDDDDGDTRDAKWGWFHRSRTVADSDETWKNPSLMGTAILE